MTDPRDTILAQAGVGNGSVDKLPPADRDLVERVGGGKSVLYIGAAPERILRALQQRVCDVTLVDLGADRADVAIYCERIVTRVRSQEDPAADVGPGRFDVLVLDGGADARTFEELFRSFAELVRFGGKIIGRQASGRGQARLPEGLATALEQLGFVVVQLEVAADDSSSFVAYRVPQGELEPIYRGFQDLARAGQRAERDLAVLRESAAEVGAARDEALLEAQVLRERSEVMAAERDAVRADVHSLGDRLLDAEANEKRLSRELAAAEAEAAGRRDLVASLETRIREVEESHSNVEQALAEEQARARALGAQLESRIREVEESHSAVEKELAGAQHALEQLQRRSRWSDERRDAAIAKANSLRRKVRRLNARDRELRAMLLDAHEQLLRRDEELAAAFSAQLGRAGDPVAPDGGYLRYREIVARVRELVDTVVPDDATLAVISKGDDELLELGGRTGWHLPQTEDGVYLGYHPVDGGHAVDQLEWLRERGAEFLVLPGSVWWWLDHYVELRDHLAGHYATLVREEGVCLIVDLRTPAPEGGAAGPADAEDLPDLPADAASQAEPEPAQSPVEDAAREDERRGIEEREASARRAFVERARELVRHTVPAGATVAVVSRGDEDLVRLDDGRVGRHLPQAEGAVYAGYHPADSITAIAQLEALREEGADYLLVPAPQLWWLDHYVEFGEYLASTYRRLAHRADAGAVYDVSGRRRWLPWSKRLS